MVFQVFILRFILVLNVIFVIFESDRLTLCEIFFVVDFLVRENNEQQRLMILMLIII